VRRRLVGLAENEESHRRTGYFCRPRRAPGRRCRSANLFQSRKNSVACSLRKTNRPLPSDLPDKQAGDFDDSVAWAANERALPPSRTKPLLALGSRGQEPVTGVKSVVSSTMRARADVHTRARPRGCDGPGSRSRPSRAQLEGVDRWRHTVCSAFGRHPGGLKDRPQTVVDDRRRGAEDQRFHKLGFALLSPIYVGPRSRSRSDEAGWLLTRRRFTRDHPWLQVSRRVAGPEP